MEVLEAAFLVFVSWVVCAPKVSVVFLVGEERFGYYLFIVSTIILVQCHCLVKKEMKCLGFCFFLEATSQKGQDNLFFVGFFFSEPTCCSVLGSFNP